MKMKNLFIIKVGGNVIDEPESLKKFLLDFSHIRGNKILIHGGGKTATGISQRLGIEPVIVKGRRVTNEETLKVVTMVYAGLINKNVVAMLQANNCNGIGLSGPDANIIPAIKREKGEVDYGFAGDIVKNQMKVPLLRTFIELGLTPVISSITHDGKGNLLNTNADTIASELASAFASNYYVQLIYCFDKKGVLKDVNDEKSLISSMSQDDYEEYKKQGKILDGMIPKLDNAFDAINKGVKKVKICNATQLLNLINSPEHIGTELIS
jgi:acetylglutamate kinase